MEPVEQEGRKDLKMSIATHSIRMEKKKKKKYVPDPKITAHKRNKIVAPIFIFLLILSVSWQTEQELTPMVEHQQTGQSIHPSPNNGFNSPDQSLKC